MKLISCHIENFGNLSDKDYVFDGKLTSFYEVNGYGKTTLAHFIKAMFYGFKTTKVNDKDLGERARYYPFGGGKFGGYLLCEAGGKNYKIVRYFDKKSSASDEISIYIDGGLYSSSEGDAGKLLKIDEESFLKTVFVDASDTDSGATPDISNLMNGFFGDSDYEVAIKKLKEEKKKYKLDRGKGGLIDESKAKIKALDESIREKQSVQKGLEKLNEQRADAQKRVDELQKSYKKLGERKAILQNWEIYDNYIKRAEAEKEGAEQKLSEYPSGLPQKDEIEKLEKCYNSIKISKARLKSATPHDEERENYLKNIFGAGIYGDEEYFSVREAESDIVKCDARLAALSTRLTGESDKFKGEIPSDEEMNDFGEKLSLYKQKRGITPQTPPKNNSKKGAIAVMAIAAALLVLGLGLLFVQTIVGVIIAVTGGIAAAVAAFLYFNGRINGIANAAKPVEDSTLAGELRAFLIKYGYNSDGGIEGDFYALERDRQDYLKFKQEREQIKLQQDELSSRRESARKKVIEFLQKYGCSGENIRAQLDEINSLKNEYRTLVENKSKIEQAHASDVAAVRQNQNEIEEILNKYNLSNSAISDGTAEEAEEGIRRLKEDRAQCDNHLSAAKNYEAEAQAHKKKYNLQDRIGEEEDGEDVELALNAAMSDLNEIQRQIRYGEEQVKLSESEKEQLSIAEREKKKYEEELQIIESTITYIEAAEQNLKDKYVKPVKDKFVRYGNALEQALGEKVNFDKDYKITFERGGEERSDKHLSSGQKSLCALCLRLAFIDNMYPDEKPFIIMDDPFVHLDESHFERAKKLLKTLSQDRQIIYLCCHESRKI